MAEKHSEPSGGLTDVADVKRTSLLHLTPFQEHFTQETRVIVSNNESDWLRYEQGTKNWYSGLVILQANARLQDLSL